MKTRPDLAVSFKNVADYVYSRKKKLDFVKANMGRMSAAGKEALTRVIQFIANGRIPLEWTELRTLLATSRGVALGKDDGGIRPIGISDVFLQIACGVIARKVAPAAAPYCGGNLAMGTKGAPSPAGEFPVAARHLPRRPERLQHAVPRRPADQPVRDLGGEAGVGRAAGADAPRHVPLRRAH